MSRIWIDLESNAETPAFAGHFICHITWRRLPQSSAYAGQLKNNTAEASSSKSSSSMNKRWLRLVISLVCSTWSCNADDNNPPRRTSRSGFLRTSTEFIVLHGASSSSHISCPLRVTVRNFAFYVLQDVAFVLEDDVNVALSRRSHKPDIAEMSAHLHTLTVEAGGVDVAMDHQHLLALLPQLGKRCGHTVGAREQRVVAHVPGCVVRVSEVALYEGDGIPIHRQVGPTQPHVSPPSRACFACLLVLFCCLLAYFPRPAPAHASKGRAYLLRWRCMSGTQNWCLVKRT